MFRRKSLLELYPPDGEETRSTPYQVHDGTLFFVGGTADAEFVTSLLAAEDDLCPIIDTDGRALAGIWIGDFERASLGPHRELQISLFATLRRSPDPVPAHPFAVLRTLLVQPETLMVCHGLWNDTDRVVSHNREILALNAHRSEGRLGQYNTEFRFSFSRQDGGKIAEGCLGIRQPDLADFREIIRHIGLARLLKATFGPAASIRVANTRSAASPGPCVSRTYSRFRNQVTRLVDANDNLTIEDDNYSGLGFQPGCVQHFRGFELMFMHPKPRMA